MICRHRHERRAKDSVWPGGEYFQRFTAVSERKIDFQTDRAADPVPLHGLDRLRPTVKLIQF